MAKEWKTSAGVHGQTNFKVSHPADWELYVLPEAAIVACQQDPNALVSFMWSTGTGSMDPSSLLSRTIRHNDIRDYEVIHAEPVRTMQMPDTVFRALEQEARFTYRGERCHAQIIVQLTNAVSPFLLFWSGSIIWKQAPAYRWGQYNEVVSRIVESLRIEPAVPPDIPAKTGEEKPVEEPRGRGRGDS
ncbi:MAG: hypothetical protein M0Z59_09405 [Nitrospiraceae bacterium]|nr:hypothetical protein [Nitrospiraceae bacterium]